MSSNILTADKVYKSFEVGSQTIEILKDINFSIQDGEFLVIFGPSGCGKSTLLHILLGLEPPTKGDLLFKDKNIYLDNEDGRADIRKNYMGMVYQQPTWVKSQSVIQNVAIPLLMLGVNREEAMIKAEEKLKIVGMEDWADYFPMELSSGQQQKVSLARSLINDPELLVADEPTGNLDTISGQELMALLSSLKQEGKTIIMVTHDLEYLDFADRIFYMLDGRVERQFDKDIDQIDIQKLMKDSKKNHNGDNGKDKLSEKKEENV